MYHDNCVLAKGIKYFNCCNCGNPSTNYANGVDICNDCLEESNLCDICGKSLDTNHDSVVEILNNMAVSTIGLVNSDYEKEYKIWEVFELLSKNVVGFICSLDIKQEWKYDSEYGTLVCEDEKGYKNAIEDSFNFEELLKSSFRIVKLKDLDDEWIKIEEHIDLHRALVNKYKIRVNGIEMNENPNDEQVYTLFIMFEDCFAIVEYLKEKE